MENFAAADIAPQIFRCSFLPSLAKSAILLLAIGAAFLTKDTKSFASASDDEKTVAALETQYQAAVKNNDAVSMDRILADDFVLVTGRGKTQNKSDLLKEARSNATIYEHQEDSNRKVRVWGNTAAVTALLWAKGIEEGKPFEYKLWFSDIYVRTAAGWRYKFAQASLPLPKENAMTEPSTKRSAQYCCPIVELRQYTLHPGKRDAFIDLFDRQFVESQEAVGARVIGQFRDLDDPNRFVWLRGFRDMPSRAQALQEFYGGPVWKTHREAANAAMVDSDNVLLLRPALPTSGFLLENRERPPVGASEVSQGLLIATIYYLPAPADAEFLEFFTNTVEPILSKAGASILARLVTENSANNFPALPVREGENVFVFFMPFGYQEAYERYLAALSRSQEWKGRISNELTRRLKKAPEVLKLSPTARSQLRP
jgi:ketosteroid isomerase-like protein/quinol monooxygenase YgiN